MEIAFQLASDIEPYCETMVIAPKSVHPFQIVFVLESRVRRSLLSARGIFVTVKLHLFGGSPHKHYEMVFEKGLQNVESMDTSVPLTSAQWGDVWTVQDGEPYWGEGGVYGCVESTFREMCVQLNRDRTEIPSKRLFVESPDYGKYKKCGYPD